MSARLLVVEPSRQEIWRAHRMKLVSTRLLAVCVMVSIVAGSWDLTFSCRSTREGLRASRIVSDMVVSCAEPCAPTRHPAVLTACSYFSVALDQAVLRNADDHRPNQGSGQEDAPRNRLQRRPPNAPILSQHLIQRPCCPAGRTVDGLRMVRTPEAFNSTLVLQAGSRYRWLRKGGRVRIAAALQRRLDVDVKVGQTCRDAIAA